MWSQRAASLGRIFTGGGLPGTPQEALESVEVEAPADAETDRALADGVGVGWDEGPVSILGRASADAVGGPSYEVDVADAEPEAG